MKQKVLITGGAGYVGTSLIPQLLKKSYEVTVFDRLLWDSDVLIPFFESKNFHFIKGDVRNKAALAKAVKGQDAIVHLAAIVGFPACDMNPKLADETNIGGAKNLAAVTSKNQHIIFASSLSNYGRVIDEICTEETPLGPITRYSRNKTKAELILMDKTTCTALRPGTAFGASPRLRLDLLPHQLTISALKDKKMMLYEANAIRPFIHVRDFGRAIIHTVEHGGKMKNEVYNLGADSLNYTKKQIAEIIAKETKAKIKESDGWEDPDKRTYNVSFKKLAATGFKPTIDMKEGIQEIIRILPITDPKHKYSNAVKITK
ncbi:MAG: NAD(P)-dependent oxidoreductase [Patescibacteria group bacterium]